MSLALAAGGEKRTVRKEFVKAARGGRERGERRGREGRGEGRDRGLGGGESQNGFFPPDKSRSRPLLTHVTSFLQGVCVEGKRRRGEANEAPPHRVLGPPNLDTTHPSQTVLDPGGWVLLCFPLQLTPFLPQICARPPPPDPVVPAPTWGSWKMVK